VLLGEWDTAREAYGITHAVMLSRDNATRELLNERARAGLKEDGTLAAQGVVTAGREFCVGDRVIARRNDRYSDVDNGTRATVRAIDQLTGILTLELDAGGQRVLDAAYVAEHLEHAYALTGHGVQGATVEWAGVVGRPAEFTAEWAYTALSRARGRTRVHVIAEPSAQPREREHYAPPEPARTREEALQATRLAMRRREAEQLAIERGKPEEVPTTEFDAGARLPLREIAEAGAERAATPETAGPTPRSPVGQKRAHTRDNPTSTADQPTNHPPPEPDWRALSRQRHAMDRGHSIGR
jgi:hypothetical protein